MKKNIILSLIFLGSILLFLQCKQKNTPTTPSEPNVSVDLTKVPYSSLSVYHFFKGKMSEMKPNDRVIYYEPISSLFTDYALKKRYFWVPEGTKIKYESDSTVMVYPEGSVLIKTFYYDKIMPNRIQKILETRLMIKKGGKWIFAEYVWNDEQTEAYLNMEGMNIPISWDQNGTEMSTQYRIPSETECLTCHKFQEKAIPIGPKPQNLNKNMNYEGATTNQLLKWIDLGILENNLPPFIKTVVDYKDMSQPIDLRLRSYLDMNCAHCHREGSHCDYRQLRLAYHETENPEKIGICLPADEPLSSTLKYVIFPQRTDKSIMHSRLNSTESSIRMPLLGRTVVHQEAVQLLKDYINSLEPCQ